MKRGVCSLTKPDLGRSVEELWTPIQTKLAPCCPCNKIVIAFSCLCKRGGAHVFVPGRLPFAANSKTRTNQV
jgi:hypothetical protein